MSWITALRRRPAAGYAVVLLGLVSIGMGYGALTGQGSTASAATPGTVSPRTLAQGQELFAVTCATCHGVNAQGTSQAPSLVGVGAAAVLTWAADGMAGPPPSAAIYAAIAWICCVVNTAGLRSISGPTSLPGIRPVLIWKSTAAAPTPIRLGACDVP